MRVAVLHLQRHVVVGTSKRSFASLSSSSTTFGNVVTLGSSSSSSSSTSAYVNIPYISLSNHKRSYSSALSPSTQLLHQQNSSRRENFSTQGRRIPATTATTNHQRFFSSVSKDDTEESKAKEFKPEKHAILKGEDSERFPWDLGITSLLPEWKRMFSKETLFTDISAGLTVGCIAVPLSLAIALASGVPAEVGLVTAAVSGVAGGLLGGTTLAVTGPAAAISLLVVGAVQAHGLEALPVITLGCGALQMASGMTKLGVVAKLVPVSVIAGFTTGVGTLILTGQLPKALGMTAPAGMNPIELMGFIGENAAAINPSAAALAVGTSAAMFMLPKIHAKMPSALVAVGGATLATHAFGLDVSLIGNIPSGLEAFQFGLP
ncbi:MAG: hypothetical protein SGARI_006010, partial [Bacillariaceae sp.]